jgi:hypothetical protein
MSKSNTTTAAAAPTAVEVVKEVNAMVQEAVAMVQDAVSAPTDAKPAAKKRTWGEFCSTVRSACTASRIAIATAALVAFFAVVDLVIPDAPAPEAIVEVTRTKLAPLASADDGTAKMVVVARDAVDSGIDKVAAYLGW